MDVKILPEAPAIALGNLFETWARHSGNPRTQDLLSDLTRDFLDLPGKDSPKAADDGRVYASAAPPSLDNGAGGGNDGGGRGTSHRESPEGGEGVGGPKLALSLFKAFGDGGLDI